MLQERTLPSRNKAAGCYFNTVPLHPRPEELESLTSYLTRLSELNGIQSVDNLSAVFFPQQSRRVTRKLADFPPLAMNILAETTTLTETNLLAMTFYHLGKKFNRSTHPQALSRFLSGSVSDSLRYCPSCLTDTPYYRLFWRFNGLRICPDHGCLLLDKCGHCGSPISLLKAPLKIGRCPECGGDLRTCETVVVQISERPSQIPQYQQIRHFLSPAPWEENPDIIQAVGNQFATWRRARGFTSVEVAERLDLTQTAIEGMERGNVLSRGGRFQNYVEYSRFWDMFLHDLFINALQSHATKSDESYWREEWLFNQAQKGVESLIAKDIPVTQRTVSKAVGVSPGTLRNYRRVWQLMKQAANERAKQEMAKRQSDEDTLFDRAVSVIESLRVENKSISQRSVANALGVGRSVLRGNSRIMALLREA